MLDSNLTKVPLLGYPDTSSNFKIYTDASDGAIGAVLVQDCGPEDSIISGTLIYVICQIKTCKSIGLPTARHVEKATSSGVAGWDGIQ